MREPDFINPLYAWFGDVRVALKASGPYRFDLNANYYDTNGAKKLATDLTAAIAWHERRKDAVE